MSEENEKPKPRLGRPPVEFKDEYCEMLIEHMSQGKSFETFAAVLGTCRDVIYKWCEKYPNFKDAKKIGQDCSYQFWEQALLNHMVTVSESEKNSDGTSKSSSKALNSSAFIFAMKNRFGWRDKQEIEHTGDQDKPVNMNIFNLKYARKKKDEEKKD